MVVNIYLIGYMGSGKTTFGKKLAKALGGRYFDLDAYIEEKEQRTIPEIFAEDGEAVFREIETRCLAELSSADHDDAWIISSGGGTPCFSANVDVMKNTGFIVYLEMPVGALVNRLINAKEVRPLIEGKSEEELYPFIKDHLAEREPYYRLADYIMNGIDPDVNELIKGGIPGLDRYVK